MPMMMVRKTSYQKNPGVAESTVEKVTAPFRLNEFLFEVCRNERGNNNSRLDINSLAYISNHWCNMGSAVK